MATTGIGLNQPLVASGEARTYFFNGRLLSAEDLQREQALRETGQRRLARLAGCGIERGLDVGWTAGSSKLAIGAGLGVTPSGEVIETAGFTLDLAQAAQAAHSGGFADCAAAFGGGGALAGAHLLVLAPAWVADGRAPTLMGDVGACNRNVELPAVRARLVPLRLPSAAAGADTRNRLAYALLTPAVGSAGRLVGWMPASVVPTLGADDLPIALVQIDAQANVLWADPEAAHRRLAAPPGGDADRLWPRSRRIEMEAFARQAGAQLTGSVLPAAKSFFMLPPLLLLDGKGAKAWTSVFPNLGNFKFTQHVGREGFASALDGGLEGDPVPPARAVVQIFELTRAAIVKTPTLYLLRLRDRDDPDAPEQLKPFE